MIKLMKKRPSIDVYSRESMSNISNDNLAIEQISFIKAKLANLPNDSGMKQRYDSIYSPSLSSTTPPIILLALVTFHQKRGPIIESTFPNESTLHSDTFIQSLNPQISSKDIITDLLEQLCEKCLFDGIHLVSYDKDYFIIQNYSQALYCVSCYKQIQANNKEVEDEHENTRNCIQKSLCIVSTLPLFEYFITQISVTIEGYFCQKNLKDKTIISNLFDYLSKQNYEKYYANNTLMKSFNLYSLFSFCTDKVFALIKMIMLQKRIVVFSQVPGNVCGFVMSLLSFCSLGGPLLNIPKVGQGFQILGLPLALFHSNNIFSPLFSLSDMNRIKDGYDFLIGITNKIILESKEMKYDCVINLDQGIIVFSNKIQERIITMSKREIIVYNKLVDCMAIDKKQQSKYDVNDIWLRKETDHLNENEQIEKIISNYFICLFYDISLAIELCQGKIDDYDQLILEDIVESLEDRGNYKLIDYLTVILNTYNIDFISQWIQTNNFYQWYISISTSYLSQRSMFYKEINNITIQYINGDYFHGDLKEGKMHEKGTYYYCDNDQTYIGSWYKNKRHGTGIIKNKTKTYLYEGDWYDDLMDGHGALIANGFKYTGEFKNNLFHGEGRLIDKDGIIYKGNFENGHKKGFGHQISPNGEEYQGDFENDIYEGKGLLITIDKKEYISTFKQGKMNGVTNVVIPDQGEYLITFINGIPYPNGIKQIHADGTQIDCKMPHNL